MVFPRPISSANMAALDAKESQQRSFQITPSIENYSDNNILKLKNNAIVDIVGSQ